MSATEMCYILLTAADTASRAGNSAKALELVQKVEEIIVVFLKKGNE